MANRNFPNGGKQYAFNVMPVLISAQINVGAAGAVTGLINSPGVASVVRTGTGLYTITLQDPYFSYCGQNHSMISASGPSNIASIDTVSVSPNTLTGATINIRCVNQAGAAADPASGTSISIQIRMNNSSVQ